MDVSENSIESAPISIEALGRMTEEETLVDLDKRDKIEDQEEFKEILVIIVKTSVKVKVKGAGSQEIRMVEVESQELPEKSLETMELKQLKKRVELLR